MDDEERIEKELDGLVKDMAELNGTFQELSAEVGELTERQKKNGRLMEKLSNGELIAYDGEGNYVG